MREVETRKCGRCDKAFDTRVHNRAYCSTECRRPPDKTNVVEDKTCKRCNKPFSTKFKKQIYCAIKCQRPQHYGKVKGIDPTVPPGTVGAISELMIAADLMSRGYQVFRCLSPHSFCDLVAFKGDECRKIEVRSGIYNEKRQLRFPTDSQGAEEFGVYVPEDKSVHYLPVV